jgi:amidophosphoribosyltransferase
MEFMVGLLRHAGAASVHVRIASAPYVYPCFMGMNTPDKSKLISAYLKKTEITSFINADSLEFLTPQQQASTTAHINHGKCDACTTGNYAPELELPERLQNEVEVNFFK